MELAWRMIMVDRCDENAPALMGTIAWSPLQTPPPNGTIPPHPNRRRCLLRRRCRRAHPRVQPRLRPQEAHERGRSGDHVTRQLLGIGEVQVMYISGVMSPTEVYPVFALGGSQQISALKRPFHRISMAKVSVVPSAAALVIKALKESECNQKKTKNIKHNSNISLDDVIKIAKGRLSQIIQQEKTIYSESDLELESVCSLPEEELFCFAGEWIWQ
nr:60s ribosomal protein l12-3 [Quercus suber]